MNHLTRILSTLLIFFFLPVSSQSPNLSLKFLPPSPTAASLGKYGDVPVSYYSGAANLNVPLYKIKTNRHELDINLQYSTTGLKPNEEASWVGLGWALNAGGVITRVMRGSDDFSGSYGYWQGFPLPACDANNNYIYPGGQQGANDHDRFSSMLIGTDDGEPDIFYYNFGEHSGKFVLNKSAQSGSSYGGPVLTAERNNLSIVYDYAGWVITDGNGYKYYFYQTEKTRDHGFVQEGYFNSYTSFNFPPQSYIDQNVGHIPASQLYNIVETSWYLTKIVSPEGEVITLTYTTNSSNVISSAVSTNEEQYSLLYLTNASPSCSGLNAWFSNIQYGYQDHTVTYLSQITFNGGYILFNNTSTLVNSNEIYRDDLIYPLLKPQKLRNMEVYNDKGNLLKRFVFSYSYFNTPSNNQSATVNADSRLRLDNIVEYGGDGITSKPPYQFTYTTPTNFPVKTSLALDWWGYYNGHTENQSLLPAGYLTNPATNAVTYYGGGDRTPTTVLSNLLTGTLNTVTYPTGGKTTFDYELNTYIAQINNTATLQTGGGLRVKTITNYDASNVALVKNYLYTQEGFPAGSTSTSSGLLLSTPNFAAIQPLGNFDAYSTGPYTVVCISQGGYFFRTSSSLCPPGFSANGATIGYSKVTEVIGPNAEGGATEYNYRNTADVVSNIPSTPSLSASDNGLLNSVLYRDNVGNIKKRIDNTYTLKEQYSAKGLKVISCDRGDETFTNNFLLVKYYDNPSAWYVLASKTETDFINGTTQVAKTTAYTYANSVHKEATSEAVTQSDGSILTTKYKRIPDYTTSGFATSSVYYAMNSLNMVSPVIETQTFVQRGTSSKMLSGSITDYKLVTGNTNSLGPNTTIVAPGMGYEFHVAKPQACTTVTAPTTPCMEFESSIAGSTLSKNSNYESVVSYDNYDTQGNLLQYTKANDVPTSLLWGYKQNYLIGQALNAGNNSVAYTSFEDDGTGSNWNIPASGLATSNSKTGGSSFYTNTNNGTPITSNSLPLNTYKVSFWAKNTNPPATYPPLFWVHQNYTTAQVFSITGTDWGYYEAVLPNFSGVLTLETKYDEDLDLSQYVFIDDLRIYPVGAQMTSFTHAPLVGPTSTGDPNHIISYFTYDPLGRLYLVQDQDKNIVKKITYQYK